MLAQAEGLGARFSDSILAEAGEALPWIASGQDEVVHFV